jgi:mannose-6-phosphate isomerase-like protein (cupin superfamily)
MLIDFNLVPGFTIPNLNNGMGEVSSKMFFSESGKIMCSTLAPGCSIGMHEQKSGGDINYVISGTGLAICDGVEEDLRPGLVHYCPKGAQHSIINNGKEDLVLFSVTVEG